jgi:hypothetical protein
MNNVTASSLLTRNIDLVFNTDITPIIEIDPFVKGDYFKMGGDTQRILNLLEED